MWLIQGRTEFIVNSLMHLRGQWRDAEPPIPPGTYYNSTEELPGIGHHKGRVTYFQVRIVWTWKGTSSYDIPMHLKPSPFFGRDYDFGRHSNPGNRQQLISSVWSSSGSALILPLMQCFVFIMHGFGGSQHHHKCSSTSCEVRSPQEFVGILHSAHS